MRFFQITWILSKYTVFYKFTSHRKEGLGRRLKLAFGELGLTFIKIGQILSMRYDLLSRKDCEALQELLDRVNPITFEDIIKLIEKEYGKPWYEVFAVIYSQPLGSASVSQVHKAELFDGTKVAVKVKRSGVDDKFLEDIKIMKKLGAIASFFSRTLRHIQVNELINYFEGWIKQDLDFVLEAKNMRLIKDQYSFGDERHFRPDLGKGLFIAPFENLCTKNIVVMDFIDGIPMSRKEEILANPDYDIEKSLKTYMNAAMRNWFRDDIEVYLFQADPHLSNVLALPHGNAANIDCGLISELTKKEADVCRKLIIAVYMQDIDKTGKIVAEMTGVDYQKYATALRPDLENYLVKTRESGFGFWFIELARILIKHRIKFPLFITTFGRTNLVLDGLMATYMPEQTTLDIVGDELRRYAIKQTVNNIMGLDWLRLAYAVSEKVKDAPELISDLITDPLAVVSKVAAAARAQA
jgi:ubiquinone biosynthesis protein